MNKKIVNSSKSKKEIFQSFEKKPKSFSFKNQTTSQRTRSLGGHR